MDAQRFSTRENVIGSPWWLYLLEGIAALIIGILLVISPRLTTLILIQFLGFYWVFNGILSLVSLSVDRSLWGLKLVGGILGVLAGIVVIRNPLWSTLFITTFLVIGLGIMAIYLGIVKLFQGFSGGGLGAFALGVLNIIIGLILLGSPFIAALTLPYVIGILAIIGGLVAIFGAFRSYNSEVKPTPLTT